MWEVTLRDLDNNSSNIWHRGRIIDTSNIIRYPPGSVAKFDSRFAELLVPNNKKHDLKRINEAYLD